MVAPVSKVSSINYDNYDETKLSKKKEEEKSSGFTQSETNEDSFVKDVNKTLKETKTSKKDGEKNTKKASKTSGSSSTKSSEEIQQELDELNSKKEKNEKDMEELENKIEELVEKAEEEMANAIELQKAGIKDHEEKAKSVVKKQLGAYIEANKNGEGMSRKQLQTNISNAMPDAPELANALAAFMEANDILDEIDVYVGELGSLIQDTKTLESSISSKNSEYEEAKKAEEEAARCDPIGFTIGEGDDKAQYDFIVDDGSFDSLSDFLGSDNQWSSMTALDTNKDGFVNTDELKAGNIKAVKTDANGNQSVVDLANEFGNNFSINLNSYTQGGSHSAIDTTSDFDNNGTTDQSLLGTYTLNIDNQDVQGYNTLDDCKWLSTKYNVSNTNTESIEGACEGTCKGTPETSTESISEITDGNISEALQEHVNKYEGFLATAKKLRAQLEEAFKNFSLDQEQINAIDNMAKEKAQNSASSFLKSLGISTKKDDLTEEEETTTAQTVTADNDTVSEIANTPENTKNTTEDIAKNNDNNSINTGIEQNIQIAEEEIINKNIFML